MEANTKTSTLLAEISALQQHPENVDDQVLLTLMRRMAADLSAIEQVLDRSKAVGRKLEVRSRILQNLDTTIAEKFDELNSRVNLALQAQMGAQQKWADTQFQNIEAEAKAQNVVLCGSFNAQAETNRRIELQLLAINQYMDEMEHKPLVEAKRLEAVEAQMADLRSEMLCTHKEFEAYLKRVEAVAAENHPVAVKARQQKAEQKQATEAAIADSASLLAQARELVDSRLIYGLGNPNIPEDPVTNWSGIINQMFSTPFLLPGVKADMPFVEAAAIIKQRSQVGKLLRTEDVYKWVVSNNGRIQPANAAVLTQMLMDHYRWKQDYVWNSMSPRSQVEKFVKDIERKERVGKYKV